MVRSGLRIGIVVFWAGLVAVLIYRHEMAGQALAPSATLRAAVFSVTDEWHGAFHESRRVGYRHTRLQKVGEEYQFTQEARLDRTPWDLPSIHLTVRCLTDSAYQTKSFDWEMREGEKRTQVRGEVTSNTLYLFTTVGETFHSKAIDLGSPAYLSVNFKPALYRQGLAEGKRFRALLVDPGLFEIRPAVFSVEGVDAIKVKDELWGLFRVRTRLADGDHLWWINEWGATAKETKPGGLYYLLETPRDAQRPPAEEPLLDPLDRISLAVARLPEERLSRWKAQIGLEKASPLTRLRVALSSVEEGSFPALLGGRQRMVNGVLEIVREELPTTPTYGIPYEGGGFERELAATPWIQKDEHQVADVGRIVTKRKTDSVEAAAAIMEWVSGVIQRGPSMRLLPAGETVAGRRGDAFERAILMAAMARSKGIPAKTVAGLVYLKGGFYLHAWNEVYVGRWVSLDPTFNQFPADVSHIRLYEGELAEFLPLIPKLRNLRIAVREAA
jgi:transglutaminase-like putative cysteine protease